MVLEFAFLVSSCAANVHPDTMAAVVSAESDFNPFAIGVVRGKLSRQPASYAEARDTVNRLEAEGFNYSVGLAQVNKVNFERYGLDATNMFDPCSNLSAGSSILEKCFLSSKADDSADALKEAFSCYYSGSHNKSKFYKYVNRVISRSRVDFSKVNVNTSDRTKTKKHPIKITRTHKKKNTAKDPGELGVSAKAVNTAPVAKDHSMVSHSNGQSGLPSTKHNLVILGDREP